MNPRDPWAWVGLAGDLIDVVVPFVGGIGEVTRAIGATVDVVDAVDDINDAGRVADKIEDAAETANALSEGLCFVAGTEVLIQDGITPIENICTGDVVWAWDEETGDVALKEVVETYVNETDELVHIFVNGEEIITTPAHPFYSPVKGWTDAVYLRAGDILVLVNGGYVVVEKVQHEILEAPITVYNFHVADYHTYYVTIDGILVHNSCATKMRTADQQALADLAKEVNQNAKQGEFISYDEAKIIDEWAIEYNVPQHHTATIGSGEHWATGWDHTHIYNIHVPFLN